MELLSERLQKVEGDEIQTELGSALIEISQMIKEKDLNINLNSLLTKAGNTPIGFDSKFYKYMGNNFVFYKSHFSNPEYVDFRLSFLKYYFSNYNEFNYDRNLSVSMLEYERLTYQKLENLILRDLHLTINDFVNELLDRNGEYGEKPLKISMNTIKRTFGLSNNKQHTTLAKFLDPYLFQMQRHLIKKDKLNNNKHFQNLRGLIGEFSHDQFFALVFDKKKAKDHLNFKNLFSGLNKKIEKEFPNFQETILKPRLLSEELEKSVVDYIQSPDNSILGNQMITAMLCGLNENIKAQAFGSNKVVVHYCHYNSLYTAFRVSIGLRETQKKNLIYPRIGTLIKLNRSISSKQLN